MTVPVNVPSEQRDGNIKHADGAAGFRFTVTVTSLVCVPHDGEVLLVTVMRSVTLPTPVIFTEGSSVLPFVITTPRLEGLPFGATAQDTVPCDEVPSRLNV